MACIIFRENEITRESGKIDTITTIVFPSEEILESRLPMFEPNGAERKT